MTEGLVSPVSFSESDVDWDLPPADLVETPLDKVELVNPPANTCPTCGELVVREPGSRGRLPKYHPECRPSRAKGSTSVSGTGRVVRVGKAEQVAAEETEMVIERIRRAITKAVVLLSLVEPYDAFVIRINTPEILDNLRPLLMRFAKFRAFAVGADTGGSALGLILALLTTALPIAAHHGLIPSKKVAQIFLNIPVFMMRLQEKLSDGDEATLTEELFKRVQAESRRTEEARMREQSREESPYAGSRQAVS